jgi:hypothetical protein
LEKVIDISLKFAPAPEDAVKIALPGTDVISTLIAENCEALRISNIRVIKKIERFMRILESLFTKFDPKVTHQAAHSITLLAWSKFQPTVAPALEYLKIKKSKDHFGLTKPEDISPDEAAWNALLDAYGFTWMDEFDFALLKGIEDGFFDTGQIQRFAVELDNSTKMENRETLFDAGWRAYHDSFADNQDAVLDTIYDGFKKSVQSISPINLNGTIVLFKDLGRVDQASELLRFYLDERKDEQDFWDLNSYPFAGDMTDSDVKDAFQERYKSLEKEIDPVKTLIEIADRHGWEDREITALANLSVDEYRQIFKLQKDKNLRKILASALKFEKIGGASSDMKEISKRARQALTLIGMESAINARRVRSLGIKID